MIDAATAVFGILGRPVRHSLSPAMHNAAFAARGLNAVYVAFEVRDLPRAVEGLRGLRISGVSVTIPFKEEIMPLLDDVDARARGIGAVNTVIHREGRLVGTNTDWEGAARALGDKIELTGQHTLLLGAGGAGRAIIYALQQAGGRVSVTDPDTARAAALARDFGVESVAPGDLNRCPATILINASPVGMTPQTEDIPFPPEELGRFAVVMDIVYSPLETRLLREARGRGAATIDGLQMLIYQGARQFELFTGQPAPVEVMRRAAYAALEGHETD